MIAPYKVEESAPGFGERAVDDTPQISVVFPSNVFQHSYRDKRIALAGDVPVIVGTTVLLAGQIESGAIRGLAVTSPARTKLLPNVPSAQEGGVKGYDVRTWAGLLVPKGTPPDIVRRLNAEIQSMLADPATKTALETATGGEARSSTPKEMRALIIAEIDKWSKAISDAGIPRI